MRTTIHIAPYLQPDGHTLARMTLDFKGQLTEAEAIARAVHIIHAKVTNHTDRGYLLSCINLGNFILGDLPAPTTPRSTATPADTDTGTDTHPHIPSRNAADTPDGAATATLKPSPQYTGTAVLGIAAMHKSNLVPVFSQEQALDTATMRRG